MEAFHHWDKDGSGHISEDELSYVLTELGMCRKSVHNIFVAADTNGDGVLSYEEFVSWAFGGGHDLLKQVDGHVTHEIHALDPEWKPVLLNLRKRFPNVDDKVIQNALEEAQGHGGTAVKLLKDRGSQPKRITSVTDGLSSEEQQHMSNLCKRFPDVSRSDIQKSIVQAEGSFTEACAILRKDPNNSAFKNLELRFPHATVGEIVEALEFSDDHPGKAASFLHKRVSILGEWRPSNVGFNDMYANNEAKKALPIKGIQEEGEFESAKDEDYSPLGVTCEINRFGLGI